MDSPNVRLDGQLRALILQECQLVMGCTEPAMIALAAAHASRLASEPPDRILVTVSTGVYKNARFVGLPGLDHKGIDVAAAIGWAIGMPELGLQILNGLTDERRDSAERLLRDRRVVIEKTLEHEGLYVHVRANTRSHVVETSIEGCHDNVSFVSLDGVRVQITAHGGDRLPLCSLQSYSFVEILEAVSSMDLAGLRFLADGARANLTLARAALEGECKDALPGLSSALQQVASRTPSSIHADVHALAAAAVSARMAGTRRPVLTCAGSGNQGLLVSIPVCVFYDSQQRTSESENDQPFLRALLLAHSVNLFLKAYTGVISALCGAVTGGAGVAAAVCALSGGTQQQIANAVLAVLGSLYGMLCDGAKGSCAFKISSGALEGLIAGMLAVRGAAIGPGNGLLSVSVDETASRLGSLTRDVLNRADNLVLDMRE